MPDLTLSKHFVENWERRVGGTPTPEMIKKIIEESVFVQAGADLKRPNGRSFRMLATYWHPDLGVILRVDTTRNVAVSVLSRKCAR